MVTYTKQARSLPVVPSARESWKFRVHLSRIWPQVTGRSYHIIWVKVLDFTTQVLGWDATAEAPLWLDPVAGLLVAHTPRQRLAAPRSVHSACRLGITSARPPPRGSRGSELRSSTGPGAAGAAVVPKGVVATDGPDHLPTAPRGVIIGGFGN